MKTQANLEAVIAELENNLATLQLSFKTATANLNVLRQCVETDDLTRLLRRGAFMQKLHNLLAQAKEKKTEVQLVMVDIDHFKKVNDTHGHQAGDAVLARVSSLIQNYMGAADLAGRYGGEELILAISGDAKTARILAEKIREAIATHAVELQKSSAVRVTVSMGMASTKSFGFDATELVHYADLALYRAKRTGRNRVELSDSQSVLPIAA